MASRTCLYALGRIEFERFSVLILGPTAQSPLTPTAFALEGSPCPCSVFSRRATDFCCRVDHLFPLAVDQITPEIISDTRNRLWLFCRYPAIPSTAGSRSQSIPILFLRALYGCAPGLEEARISTCWSLARGSFCPSPERMNSFPPLG